MRIVRPAIAFSSSFADKRRPRVEYAAHLKWIRTLPCIITKRPGVEAAHIRFADVTWGKHHPGQGQKPDDMWVVPLSPEKHREQHSMNERLFWQQQGIDPLKIALVLFVHSGDDEIAQTVINHAAG